MSLLLPELERQLKSAARRRRAEAPTPVPRRRRPTAGGLIAGLVAAAALALGAVAVVLVHHRGRARTTAPSQPQPPTVGRAVLAPGGTKGCQRTARGQAQRRPRYETVAGGVIDGHDWAFQLNRATPNSTGAIEHGRFRLGGRGYPTCALASFPIGFELIDAGPHGIVVGFLAATGYRISFGTPAQVHLTPLSGGTLIVAALSRSACTYRSLTLTASHPTAGGSKIIDDARYTFDRCRAGHVVETSTASAEAQGPGPASLGSPNAIAGPVPGGLSAAQRREYRSGRTVVSQAGCLACHTIGTYGNNGPGPDLTHIGDKLRGPAIRSALLQSPAPMPSFRGLGARKLKDLVFYLSELRARR